MATELFSATFDSAADLASYDLRTSGNSDTQIVTENGNGVLDIGLDRFADAVSYRSEVELAGRNPARFAEIGKTYTYSFDMRLGANWVHDDRPEILFQLHSSPDEGDGSRSPLLALQLMPSQDHSTTYYSIVQRADDRAISEGMPSSHVTTTVGRIDGDIGDWVNWTFQIHFSPENDGWLTVWKDGVIVLQQEGQANCFNDAVGPYAKWGVYKWDWESGTSIASSRSVQYDNLRIVEGDDAPVPADSAPLDSTQLSEALALASGGHAYSQYLDAVDQANGGVSMKGDFGDGTLIGTPFDDNLQDSWGNDILYGGAGNDRLASGLGADIVYGGTGNDRIELGDGDDLAYGEEGDDTLLGGTGNDQLYGGTGNDTLDGGPGDDSLDGGDGDDRLVSGAGNDTVHAGSGNDRAELGDGDDTAHGGDGNDTLIGGAGKDLLYGDQGDDILRGQDGNDFLFGGGGNDRLEGGAGDDRLEGGWGRDILIGGGGNDRMIGGGDADRFVISGNTSLMDFSRSDGDKIDVSAFGMLAFIGTEAFSASGAAELRLAEGRLLVDLDGNGAHDYCIGLLGVSDTKPAATDFIFG